MQRPTLKYSSSNRRNLSILPPSRVNDRSVFQTRQSNDFKNSPLLCFLGYGCARCTENDSKRPRRLLVLIREMHIDAYSAQIIALSVKQGYLCMKEFYSGRPQCPRANLRENMSFSTGQRKLVMTGLQLQFRPG